MSLEKFEYLFLSLLELGDLTLMLFLNFVDLAINGSLYGLFKVRSCVVA